MRALLGSHRPFYTTNLVVLTRSYLLVIDSDGRSYCAISDRPKFNEQKKNVILKFKAFCRNLEDLACERCTYVYPRKKIQAIRNKNKNPL